MKKLLIISCIALLFIVLFGCGPSQKELRAKVVRDSTHVADSLAQITHFRDSVATQRKMERQLKELEAAIDAATAE